MDGAAIWCLRRRWTGLLCLGVLLAACIHPAEGLGVNACSFKWITGYPCFSCGLTRSLSCTLRGRWGDAVRMHPAGPPTLALLLFGLAPAVLPEGSRPAAENWFLLRRRLLNGMCLTAGALFLLYGLGRIAWLIAAGVPSPW